MQRYLVLGLFLGLSSFSSASAEPPSIDSSKKQEANGIGVGSQTHESDEQTATLRMQFIHVGKMPVRRQRLVPFFGRNMMIQDESLVINPNNGGIKNIFVFVYTGRRGVVLPPLELEPKTVVLNARNGRYEPYALITQVGDILQVHNRGPGKANPNIQFFNNQIPVDAHFNPDPNILLSMELTSPEPAPIPVSDNIYPWMKANILVVDHPFAAITDENGVMSIEGLPVDQELVFRATHEQGSFRGPLLFQGEKTSWRANKFELTLKPGVNDLGTVELDWSQL